MSYERRLAAAKAEMIAKKVPDHMQSFAFVNFVGRFGIAARPVLYTSIWFNILRECLTTAPLFCVGIYFLDFETGDSLFGLVSTSLFLGVVIGVVATVINRHRAKSFGLTRWKKL